ncbi:hypothetical protein FJY71_08185 [candidate division WOR-3 bacterium]|nr:hypothetical protein [candidate division WOR-3 bacterium]
MKRAALTLTLSLLVTSAAIGQAAALKPDTTHNVGVGEVLAPRGSVDSGQPLIPRIIVNNYGTAVETLRAFMRIGAYLDSAQVTGLPGRGSDSVSFGSWTPVGRDSMEAVSWTVCAGDSFPDDDTARVRFLIRVRDVAVTEILDPRDTLDSGEVVYPRAVVWNYGNLAESFDVDILGCTAWVFNLPPGCMTEAVAVDSLVMMPGRQIGRAIALIAGDMHPENNVVWDTVWVMPGPGGHDVVIQILSPAGTIDTTMTIVPACSVRNNGTSAENGLMFFRLLSESCGAVYLESCPVMLAAGACLRVAFPSVRLTTLGSHTARCSLLLSDTSIVCWRDFLVVPGSGIAEGPTPGGSCPAPSATLVRGVLFLPHSLVANRQSPSALLDATGRKVLALKPGRNDVRHLPAGVYFVRGTGSRGRGVQWSSAKVVVSR